MFDVLSITMDNFRSYVGSHSFDFPTTPGLYSLTGANLANPRLGTNDCGKTTLLEAIHWCLFNRTSRGVRANDVVSWGRKNCAVILSLLINDKQLLIERRQAPNSLTLNGKNVTQDELENQLRLGPDQYCHAIMLPQFGHSFFDLGASEKLNLFSQILKLDFWISRSEEAANLVKTLGTERNEKSYDLGRLEGGISIRENSIAQFKERNNNYEHLFVLANIQKREQLKIHEKSYKRLKTSRNEIEKKLKAIDKPKQCPTCKQLLPHHASQYAANLTGNQYALDSEEKEIRFIKQSLAQGPQNPYPELIDNEIKNVAELRQNCEKITKELQALDEEYAAAEFWVGAFKRVRLFVAESAIKDLELEVNGNLSSLGLTDWHISLDVERETKSGGVTKGFTVGVHAPNRVEPVRWEAFGGGATQRLRLAGNLGLANLIMERAGLTSKIEFYDEISRGMGATGISDMLETLHTRALDTSRRIFVVDHHALEFGGFAGVLKAVKDEKGSRLEWVG